MTLRLSIDDQPDQNQTPVHGPAKARGHSALPHRRPQLHRSGPAAGTAQQQPGQVGAAGPPSPLEP